MATAPGDTRRWLLVCAALIGLVLALYWPVTGYGFLNYDDPEYVTQNELVRAGINWRSVRQAFTSFVEVNYHPVTWLSHMLDCQWFGLNAGAHHLVNGLLHALNAALAFLWLRRATGATWRSAFAAAVFALHPLRVESVAWIAERKDVLSICFGLLTLLAYTSYVRHPSRWRYGRLLACFGLGLLSKPTLVTLPLAMAILDFWPLRRWPVPGANRTAGWAALLREKMFLLGLALLLGVVTLFAQREAIQTLTAVPWPARLANSLEAARVYLQQLFWPADLAVHYPWRTVSLLSAAGSAGLLLVLTGVCLQQRRQRPYLLAGWLWFGITLLPMIGLVQVGGQAAADRYTYLPHLGLVVGVTWLGAEFVTRLRWPAVATAGGAIGVLVACFIATQNQLTHWRSSEALFRRALAVTQNNARAHYNLGHALAETGKLDEAAEHYRAAIRISPTHAEAHNNLGCFLADEGQHAEAIAHFLAALPIQPRNPLLHRNLGNSLSLLDRFAEAEPHFLRSLQLQPNAADTHRSYAAALNRVGQSAEAERHLQLALQLQPTAATHADLAALLDQRGQAAAAAEQYRLALRSVPDSPPLLNNLAWLLATSPDASVRDGEAAVKLAERACALTGNEQAVLLGTLAAAYAEAGRFPEAVSRAHAAAALAQAAGQTNLVAKNNELAELYRAHRPYRAPTAPPGR